MNFSKYVVYSLRPHFSRQPGQPTRCLYCGHPLTMSSIEPSREVQLDLEDAWALHTSHDFSFLFFCENCHWWMVRESWSLNEIYHDYDSIIVGVESAPSLKDRPDEKPWLAPLADPAIYGNERKEIPEPLADLFPTTAQNNVP